MYSLFPGVASTCHLPARVFVCACVSSQRLTNRSTWVSITHTHTRSLGCPPCCQQIALTAEIYKPGFIARRRLSFLHQLHLPHPQPPARSQANGIFYFPSGRNQTSAFVCVFSAAENIYFLVIKSFCHHPKGANCFLAATLIHAK